MYRLSHTFALDSAHFLPGYPGKCRNLHGHCWWVTVLLTGQKLNQQGMLMDFSEIKQLCKTCITDRLDHQLLNTFIQQPTAENLAKWVHDQLKDRLPPQVFLEMVSVRETPGQGASYFIDPRQGKGGLRK